MKLEFSWTIDQRLFDGLDRSLWEGPVRNGLNRLNEFVAELAAEKAPHDTGKLADSIKAFLNSIEDSGVRVACPYARYVHGQYAVPAPPTRRTVPHWPGSGFNPPASLDAWASSHGIPLRLVQIAIWKSGTPIVPFLAQAVEEATKDMDKFIGEIAAEIERNWP
jgi:hypothetical protein